MAGCVELGNKETQKIIKNLIYQEMFDPEFTNFWQKQKIFYKMTGTEFHGQAILQYLSAVTVP